MDFYIGRTRQAAPWIRQVTEQVTLQGEGSLNEVIT
jgi:hypothetical protein